MPYPTYRRVAAVCLFSFGFLGGVIAAVGCGGSSATAAGGSKVFMNAQTNGVPVTVNALTLRIIPTEGIMLMDPSPNLS